MKYFKIIPDFPDYVVFRNGLICRMNNGSTPVTVVHRKQNNLRIDLYNNGKRYNKIVKKIVAQAFLQNPNNYKNILHKDEDVTNCHYTNIYHTDKQKRRGGNYGVRGEAKKKQAKLNNSKVAFILLSDDKVTKLAKKFDVSYPTIIGVKNGSRWKHISSLNREQLEALAKQVKLTPEEKAGISIDNARNKYSKQGVSNIIAIKEQERRKVPLKINSKTTIMVHPDKVNKLKRKYNLV